MRIVVILCAIAYGLHGQRVDPAFLNERLVVVVPIVGTGTVDDPLRPFGIATRKELAEDRLLPKNQQQFSEVLTFSWQPSDDGKLAIVELTMRDKSAVQRWTALVDRERAKSNDGGRIKIFERGKVARADVERELKALRKDVDTDKLTSKGSN